MRGSGRRLRRLPTAGATSSNGSTHSPGRTGAPSKRAGSKRTDHRHGDRIAPQLRGRAGDPSAGARAPAADARGDARRRDGRGRDAERALPGPPRVRARGRARSAGRWRPRARHARHPGPDGCSRPASPASRRRPGDTAADAGRRGPPTSTCRSARSTATRRPTCGSGSSSIASWESSASSSTTTSATDDHREVLGPYIEGGIVVLHDWPMSRAQVRHTTHCLASTGDDSRWIAFIDLDEFLFSPTGRPLPEMLREYERWPGVGVNWAVFGTSGHRARAPGLVIENYVHRRDPRQQRRSRASPTRPTWRTVQGHHAFRYDRLRSGRREPLSDPGRHHQVASPSIASGSITTSRSRSRSSARARATRGRTTT